MGRGVSLVCVCMLQAAGVSAFVPGAGRLWVPPAARALALRRGAAGARPMGVGSAHAARRGQVTMQQQRQRAQTGPGRGGTGATVADWPELERLQPFGDNRTPEELLRDGQKLVEDGFKLASETPPEVGLRRTLQASRAVLMTGTELLRKFQGAGRAPTTEELLAEVPATLRRLFELLGATYIKLGQFVASSPTIFPAEYVTEFQKCLDNTEPVPFSRIKRVIESDLKRPLSEVYSFVDEKPLATASIAQVHAAKLLSGEDVVIKVQKPGVDSLLTADLAFVSFATKVLEFLQPDLKRLSLADITGDIRTTMLDELDFQKEAKNMAEFRAFLAASGNKAVMCPDVYPAASSKKVLTMQRLYGRPLVDLDAIRAYSVESPEATLITALNTWTASVIGCSSFHADVHAGNLLVLQDGRIAFIDFGIVGKISPRTWQALEGIIQGFATNDFETMAEALVRLGATGDKVNTKAFAADIRQVIERIERMDVDVVVTQTDDELQAQLRADDEEVTRTILELVAIGQEYGIKFPRDFGLLIKQTLYFDRYTKLLAPGLDVVNDERIRSSVSRLARDSPLDTNGALDVDATEE